ncbi:MAG TPA: nicotinamide-nucleotide amidohydrolase family protein [Thiobacillaceae bacterium]|nr:nicotinamide-nucleotide amidohydrolase family protein [Thiobacillaceae bacterium]HNU65075.1 nicotinamide-nucleotide amidohydrolase family protein [Thiobacillaceae bacterium]
MDVTQARLEGLALELGQALLARGWMLACAESCTGGWAAQACTAIAGSSAWFERGFVTYSNAAKMELLGVSEPDLLRHGAVSLEVARAMAEGVLAHSRARVAFAITGIAGPTGGSPEKPVGTVCFAWAVQGREIRLERALFAGDRRAIRAQAVAYALGYMRDAVA